MKHPIIAAFAASAAILGCATFFLGTPALATQCQGQLVTASHYGAESGRRTADGSYFDGTQMVAAHRSWTFGTKIRVSYRGKSVVLIVRDRGPFIRGRSLDISTAAARRIGLTHAGVGRVCVERL